MRQLSDHNAAHAERGVDGACHGHHQRYIWYSALVHSVRLTCMCTNTASIRMGSHLDSCAVVFRGQFWRGNAELWGYTNFKTFTNESTIFTVIGICFQNILSLERNTILSAGNEDGPIEAQIVHAVHAALRAASAIFEHR